MIVPLHHAYHMHKLLGRNSCLSNRSNRCYGINGCHWSNGCHWRYMSNRCHWSNRCRCHRDRCIGGNWGRPERAFAEELHAERIHGGPVMRADRRHTAGIASGTRAHVVANRGCALRRGAAGLIYLLPSTRRSGVFLDGERRQWHGIPANGCHRRIPRRMWSVVAHLKAAL
jgi:hypothetical protein